MKTKMMNKIERLAIFIAVVFVSGTSVFAQFEGTTTIEQDSVEERKGSLSEYSIVGPAGDDYSWEVTGGTIISPPPGTTGDGSELTPYVIPFTTGLDTIEVQWPEDDSTITSMRGNVSVQRKVAHDSVNCPSVIQSLDVVLWSNPTATIQDVDYEICSGDITLGPITVEFTGAPGFDFAYTVTDMDGTTSAETQVPDVTTGTTTITIPGNLVNLSSTVDQTFTVNLTSMNDVFTGSTGALLDDTFTITVHPTIETGDIGSNNGLSR
jgi:hypothetical protein